MFQPKTARIAKLAILYPDRINELSAIFHKKTNVYLEIRKCNFDVEIGRDMLLDFERNSIDTYILWSGDSDFADPVTQLMKDKKKVFIFATSRRVSVELQETKAPIFDIQKIRNFICEPSEIQPEIRGKLQ